jgi:hypothetical protein
MELKKVDHSGVSVLLRPDDLLAICNALNEVCNALEVPEFSSRIGVGREEALTLLREANAIYERAMQPT